MAAAYNATVTFPFGPLRYRNMSGKMQGHQPIGQYTGEADEEQTTVMEQVVELCISKRTE
jgi:hypothetical protein